MNVRCTQATLSALGVHGKAPRTGAGVITALIDAGMKCCPVEHEGQIRLRAFVRAHSRGRYYVFTRNHAMALVDGQLTDTEGRGPDGRIVLGAVEIQKKEVP